VRACLDVTLRFGDAPSWHDGGSIASTGCATRSPARRSVKSGGSSEIEKSVGRFPQLGNKLWKTNRSPGCTGGARTPPGPPVREVWFAPASRRRRWPAHRWKAPRVRQISLFFAVERVMRPSVPGASAQATRPRRSASCESQGSRRRARPAAPRKRVVEGPRAPTLRGGGAREMRSSWALLPDGSSAGQRRSLQPAVPRSHDERCPSGSGWDKSPLVPT